MVCLRCAEMSSSALAGNDLEGHEAIRRKLSTTVTAVKESNPTLGWSTVEATIHQNDMHSVEDLT